MPEIFTRACFSKRSVSKTGVMPTVMIKDRVTVLLSHLKAIGIEKEEQAYNIFTFVLFRIPLYLWDE